MQTPGNIAGKYLEHDANDFNLSIMVSKRYRKNTFQANPDVVLEEYVYMGRQLEAVESPFSQIALSLAKFLDTGEYVDTTGVAKVNFSPEYPPRQHLQLLTPNYLPHHAHPSLEVDLHKVRAGGIGREVNYR